MYAVIAEPALDIHIWVSKPVNHSIKLLPSRLLKHNHGCELGPSLWNNYAFAAKVRCISLRCNSCLRLKAPFVIGSCRKSLRLSGYKSNKQNDDSGSNKSVGLSYATSILFESLKAHSSVPAAYPSDTESTSGSLAILNLFKSWITLLRMPSSARQAETVEEASQHNEKTRILKEVWCCFMRLNATLKIPMLIFIPSYIVVNLMYGTEVAKELYPLWIIGPLIIALYVKLLQSIWGLYIFSFKQSIKVVKNIPNFYQVSYGYVFNGILKEHIQRGMQRLVDIKNMDYKETFIRMVKKFNSWVVEKYMDYVESVWPYYCRIIRFLKRAHLL